jgi:UDP-glucose 4-epimerase
MSKPKGSILITGGAGYIGAQTARLLSRSGFDLVILDTLATGSRENLRSGRFIRGDVSNIDLLRRVLREQDISAVIHLAASAHVGESMGLPELYFRNNTVASLHLLESMLAEGVAHLVFASSSSVYGNLGSNSLNEQDAPVPVSPYGESKLQTEKMLHWYGRAYGLRWTALRYFNVAGADDGVGENLEQSTRLFPRAIAAALGTRKPVHVFGDDFPTHDGSAVRDYVHVRDVAAANLFALRHLLNGGSGEVINIGSGQGTSVFEVVRAVEAAVRSPVPYIRSERRPGDPAYSVADTSRATAILGWRPQHSELQQILSSMTH